MTPEMADEIAKLHEKDLAKQQEKELSDLRDKFAMAALTGMMANAHYLAGVPKEAERRIMGIETFIAESAYELADCMLVHRSKGRAP
jgi:hypothetical protein